jgi:hypothetical protein
MIMSPGLIRPTVLASYFVRILVALVTSILWAWLFVFLTEIAIAGAPDANAAVQPEPVPEPAAICWRVPHLPSPYTWLFAFSQGGSG